MKKAIQKRNYIKDIRRALALVFESHPDEDLTRQQICSLAESSGEIPEEWIDGIRDQAVSKAIGAILRSSKFRDEHDVRIRQYHSYSYFTQTEDGKEVQRTFWRDIHTMNRRQWMDSIRGRVRHISKAQRQLDADNNYWNTTVAPKLGVSPVQLDMFSNGNDDDA